MGWRDLNVWQKGAIVGVVILLFYRYVLYNFPRTHIEYIAIIYIVGFLFSKKENKKLVLAIPLGLLLIRILAVSLDILNYQVWGPIPGREALGAADLLRRNLNSRYFFHVLLNSVFGIVILFLGSKIGGNANKLNLRGKKASKIAFFVLLISPTLISSWLIGKFFMLLVGLGITDIETVAKIMDLVTIGRYPSRKY